MKKWCTVLLMVVLVCALAGCGEEQATTAEPNVTIEIPRAIINVSSDQEIVDRAQSEGMEVQIDEDTVTYKMTSEKQQELLLSYKTGFEEQLPQLLDDGSIPGMLDVSYNDDMTEFKVTVDSDIFDTTMDGMAFGPLYTTGMGYQLYAGVPDEQIDVRVKVYDRDAKQPMDTYSMREVFAQHQAPGDDSD